MMLVTVLFSIERPILTVVGHWLVSNSPECVFKKVLKSPSSENNVIALEKSSLMSATFLFDFCETLMIRNTKVPGGVSSSLILHAAWIRSSVLAKLAPFHQPRATKNMLL